MSLPTVERKHVAAVVLFGDPRFNSDKSQKVVDFGSFDHKLSGIYDQLDRSPREIAPGNQPQVHSYCTKGDPICNFSAKNAALCAVPATCSHYSYTSRGYTDDAARWAFYHWRNLQKRQPLR